MACTPFNTSPGTIDILYLDADKEGYTSCLRTLVPLVRPGGLIGADNIEMAEGYVTAITTDPQMDTVLFGQFAVTPKKREPDGRECCG